jgi:hypothetical protein
VRHREKYVDMPVSEDRGFVFAASAHRGRRVVRTLREFVTELKSRQDCDEYLQRGDFSRWIADVFADHALAAELRDLEAAYRAAPSSGVAHVAGDTIRARYELGG